MPAGGVPRGLVGAAELLREREPAGPTLGGELEPQHVLAPQEREHPRRVELDDRPFIGCASCSGNVNAIAPPSRRSTSTVLGNHAAISSGTVIIRHTRSTACG